MDQVKAELNTNDEEYIDVAGEDTEVHRVAPGNPNIMHSRTRRSTRRVDASPYGQYPRQIITRTAHQRMAEKLDDRFEEEIMEEIEEDSRHHFNPIEEEIANDVALIQRTRTKRVARDEECSDFGPIQFCFESTQRKNQVIVYKSMKHPGRASEWYLARRNSKNSDETYRCVQCRRHREEIKRKGRKDVENLPEARIIVQNDRFLTDPDEPLGKHICNFDTNERTTLQSVWSRRALSKANSELRRYPEKPKEKFDQLLREIGNGREYGHLPISVRQAIIAELNSKKGFASRRRSFARNTRLGKIHGMNDDSKSERSEMQVDACGQVMYYLCGMNHCKERFATPEERKQHRSFHHSDVLFIDTKEQLDEYNNYRRLHGNVISGEELVVANEQVILADQFRGDNGEAYELIINDEEGENFYNQASYFIGSLRGSLVALVNDQAKRDNVLKLLQECDFACRELAQSAVDEDTMEQVEEKEEESAAEESLEPSKE